MQVDVNGFLGQVGDTDANFVNLSTTITAHELGHTLGLRHEDALGPIDFGISNPPGIATYYPTYNGLVGAFTTVDDIMASPASVGSSLANAASGDSTFGERDAIKLAFISDGTVVAGTRNDGTATVIAAPAAPIVNSANGVIYQANEAALIAGATTFAAATPNAQAVSLYTLNVPNPITTGINAGKAFDVAAVDVIGQLEPGAASITVPDPKSTTGGTLTLYPTTTDFYTFTGNAGDVMNFEVMSAALTRIKDPIDSVLYVYGPDGKLVAWNDDQFEPSDSSIVDLTLQMTGSYTVEIDSYNNNTDPTLLDPNAKNYNPAVYYHAQTGDYELFMYRSVAYNPTSGNSTTPADVLGVSNNPTVVVSSVVQGPNITLTATVNVLNTSNKLVPVNSGPWHRAEQSTFSWTTPRC